MKGRAENNRQPEIVGVQNEEKSKNVRAFLHVEWEWCAILGVGKCIERGSGGKGGSLSLLFSFIRFFAMLTFFLVAFVYSCLPHCFVQIEVSICEVLKISE